MIKYRFNTLHMVPELISQSANRLGNLALDIVFGKEADFFSKVQITSPGGVPLQYSPTPQQSQVIEAGPNEPAPDPAINDLS